MWVRLQQAASTLNVSERTVRRMIDRGELESEKRGRHLTVNLDPSQTVSVTPDVGPMPGDVRPHPSETAIQPFAGVVRLQLDRVQRRSDILAGVLAAVVVIAVGGAGFAGYHWHRSDIGHINTEATLTAQVGQLKADQAVLSDSLLQDLQNVRENAQRASLQAERDAMARLHAESDAFRLQADLDEARWELNCLDGDLGQVDAFEEIASSE